MKFFFHKDKFVISNCDTIDLIDRSTVTTLYALPKNSHREFRGSIFNSLSESIIAIDRYWYGSRQVYSTFQFKVDMG